MTDSQLEIASGLRIIDANGNRTLEGLRVVEDYLRFHRNDAYLCGLCKAIRHQVSETLATHFPNRTKCRSTETDVGTSIDTSSEYQRQNFAEIVAANLGRVKEALRTLEEYSKRIVDNSDGSSPAREFEAMRYQAYTLEKAIGHLENSYDVLAEAKLYVLVDLRYGIGDDFSNRIVQMCKAGVDVVQLRDKNATDRELIEAGRQLRRLLAKFDADRSVLFVMNDRPDLARVVGAGGVHVGQDEMPVADVRSLVGPDCMIGVSTHSVEQARAAVVDGADYIGVGPVFPSQTKEFNEFVGTALVSAVSKEIALPSFAIGGISLERLQQVVDCGAERVAVSEAIWVAKDVVEATREFCSILKS